MPAPPCSGEKIFWTGFFRDGREPIFATALRGAFSGPLPPGDYRVITVADSTKIFYADPEWQAKHESEGKRVTVRAGEVTRISITQNQN
jgi:hypothetical protein